MGCLRRKLRRAACRQQIRDAYRRPLPPDTLRWVLASPEPPREPGIFVRLCTDRIDADSHDPQGVFAASGAKLDRITAHAKLAAGELDVVARVLQVHQPVKEMVASQLHGGANRDDHRLVIFLAANAINARHTGDDNHVLA